MVSIFNIIAKIIVLIGTILLIMLGLYFMIYNSSVPSKGQAEVINASCNDSNDNNCVAIIQFTSNGKQYISTINGKYNVGDLVNINYDPDFLTRKVPSVVINLLIGLVLLIVGLFALRTLYIKVKFEE